MKRLLHLSFVIASVLALLVCDIGRAGATDPSTSVEQQLADKYVPVAMLRAQKKACDRDGEGYFPAPVETVLGNPEIALKQATGTSSTSDRVIVMGPTAQDLAGRDDSYYLDFPGNPRRAGCTYESTFKRYAVEYGLEPVAYAHIVFDDESALLVLQYWFWYYFNDWNNTHESDWEMIQLVFDAASASEALGKDPLALGYAQHGGGELSDWGDEKLEIDNGHPLVYPGAGSHGSYYSAQHYIGWGEDGTGFGCDNTSDPVVRTPLTAILVPEEIDPGGPFAWLLFGGRWGERAESEWNGPNGPNLGTKWSAPILAMEAWRTSSLKLPNSSKVGLNATDFFCDLSAAGSRLVTATIARPLALVAIILSVLGGITTLLVRKRSVLGAAFNLYRRHLVTFAGLGALTIPIGIGFNVIAIVARTNPPLEWVVKWFNDTEGARLTAALAVGAFQQVAMIVLVAPPVIWAVGEVRAGREISVQRALTNGYRRLGTLALGLLVLMLVLGGLTLFLVGIPVALWLAVRWQFFGQATIVDEAGTPVEAFGRSARSTNGRWVGAFGDSILFQLFAITPGPLAGAILMVLGKTSVDFANTLSSIFFAVTVPIAMIGLTLIYLQHTEALEGNTVLVVDIDPDASW